MKKNLGAKDLMIPNPMLVIGTYDGTGRPNAMALAWGGICNSEPPMVSISMREQRKTFQNIQEKFSPMKFENEDENPEVATEIAQYAHRPVDYELEK